MEENKDVVAMQQEIIRKLTEQNEQLMALIKGGALNVAAPATTRSDEITLVHLQNCPEGLHNDVPLTNYTLAASRLGEEVSVPRVVFDELVGKHRGVFDHGLFAVADEFADIAKRKNIPTVSVYLSSMEKYKDLKKMEASQLARVFKEAPDAFKESIISRFKLGVAERDPDFMDLVKIAVLNNMTNQAFVNEVKDIETYQVKQSNKKK